MIREILFPTQIGSYILFPQKILSIDLSDTSLKAMYLIASGSKITIKKWYELSLNNPEESETAIQAMLTHFGTPFNEIIITTSAQKISFKTLALPFANLAKIRQILPFELGESLPFPLEEAVLDAIPSAPENATNTNWVACAMQTDSLNRILLPLLEEGIIPTRVTTAPIDFFAFGLHTKQLAQNKTYILIAINQQETEVSIVHNQELLGVRTLARGIPKAPYSTEEEQDPEKTLPPLLQEIAFSIEIFLRAHPHADRNYSVLLQNLAGMYDELELFLQERLQKPIQSIKPIDLIKMPNIEQDSTTQPDSSFLKTIIAALPWTKSASFNLGQFFQKERQESIFIGQSILTVVLFILLIATPAVTNIMRTRRLYKEIEISKKEVTNRLKTEFNLQERQRNLKDTLTQAEQALIKNEQLWSALTTNKYAFLRYIQKLNMALSGERSQLKLQKLSIRRDDVSGQEVLGLEGSVDNFSALRDFEEGLNKSNLFTAIPRLQDLRFSILLPIKKDIKEELA